VPVIRHHDPPLALPQAAKRVLYIGSAADEVCAIVTQHVGDIDIAYEQNVQSAIALLRSKPHDVVIVDQRDESLATKLIMPLVSSLDYEVKLVVVSQFKNVASYLAVPGVARVLTAPIREGQLLRILGLQQKPKHYIGPETHVSPQQDVLEEESEQKPRKTVLQAIFDPLMGLVSTLYKRAAFVLLLVLFCAFSFYGVLIGYFLLSSSWGAPMTLARGHELVNKVERDLTELNVALRTIDQKLQQAELDRVTAEREHADAKELVSYAIGTTAKEIAKVKRRLATSQQKLKRMERAKKALAAQLEKNGIGADLDRLYSKRLIDRKTYSANTLGLLEAERHLATFETEIDLIREEAENAAATLDMLQSLQTELKSDGPLQEVTAATSDQMLLTKQSFDAKAALTDASTKVKSAGEQISSLMGAQTVLQKQIAALETATLARAIDTRIDVIFVPYGNANQFAPGSRLYSCALTIIWCDVAGTVGAPMPGEVNAVHPFFGKPIRGYFVEAKIRNATAANREIIHGARAPLFF
jgi:hypothetical protein